MKPLTARDALSDRVLRVGAERRPQMLDKHATRGTLYAVFAQDPETGEDERFLGLVTDRDIASLPQRLFADLVAEPSPEPAGPDTSLETVLQRMDAAGVEALPVTGGDGAFLGAVTRTSLLGALVRREREALEHARRLNTLVQEHSRSLAEWAMRLENLNMASRNLVKLLGHLSSEDRMLEVGIKALATILQARYAAVGILDGAGQLEQFLYTGVTPEQVAAIGNLPRGRGLLGVVVRENETLRIDDIAGDPRAQGFPPHHPPMKTLLAVPITCQGRAVGRVYLCDKASGEPFTQADEMLALSFARWISLTLALGRERVRRERAQEALRETEEQLRQSQKLEAIGRLAGGIAHDFNNLLFVILGHADIFLKQHGEDRPASETVREMHRAAERAASLTRQLLAFSRRQVLEPRVLDLNTCVFETEKMLQRLIGEDVELVARLDPDLGCVKADPAQIDQVLVNLAVNARDAMPEGGRLVIETGNVDLDETYAASHVGVCPGPYVLLSVADTGCGMDARTRSRIFEPFFTTKEVGQGTGLGLSTIYGIVKQSGGNIWCYSEPGLGTTFKIYLPRLDEAARSRASFAGGGASQRGSETILLVEDGEAVRRLASKILSGLGYTVLEACGGEEALAICEGHAGPIHLLVSDVVMPGVGVRGLARRLASTRPEMKVLFISGYTDDIIVHHGLLSGDVAFLQKPFTAQTLARKVRGVLDAPGRAFTIATAGLATASRARG